MRLPYLMGLAFLLGIFGCSKGGGDSGGGRKGKSAATVAGAPAGGGEEEEEEEEDDPGSTKTGDQLARDSSPEAIQQKAFKLATDISEPEKKFPAVKKIALPDLPPIEPRDRLISTGDGLVLYDTKDESGLWDFDKRSKLAGTAAESAPLSMTQSMSSVVFSRDMNVLAYQPFRFDSGRVGIAAIMATKPGDKKGELLIIPQLREGSFSLLNYEYAKAVDTDVSHVFINLRQPEGVTDPKEGGLLEIIYTRRGLASGEQEEGRAEVPDILKVVTIANEDPLEISPARMYGVGDGKNITEQSTLYPRLLKDTARAMSGMALLVMSTAQADAQVGAYVKNVYQGNTTAQGVSGMASGLESKEQVESEKPGLQERLRKDLKDSAVDVTDVYRGSGNAAICRMALTTFVTTAAYSAGGGPVGGAVLLGGAAGLKKPKPEEKDIVNFSRDVADVVNRAVTSYGNLIKPIPSLILQISLSMANRVRNDCLYYYKWFDDPDMKITRPIPDACVASLISGVFGTFRRAESNSAKDQIEARTKSPVLFFVVREENLEYLSATQSAHIKEFLDNARRSRILVLGPNGEYRFLSKTDLPFEGSVTTAEERPWTVLTGDEDGSDVESSSDTEAEDETEDGGNGLRLTGSISAAASTFQITEPKARSYAQVEKEELHGATAQIPNFVYGYRAARGILNGFRFVRGGRSRIQVYQEDLAKLKKQKLEISKNKDLTPEERAKKYKELAEERKYLEAEVEDLKVDVAKSDAKKAAQEAKDAEKRVEKAKQKVEEASRETEKAARDEMLQSSKQELQRAIDSEKAAKRAASEAQQKADALQEGKGEVKKGGDPKKAVAEVEGAPEPGAPREGTLEPGAPPAEEGLQRGRVGEVDPDALPQERLDVAQQKLEELTTRQGNMAETAPEAVETQIEQTRQALEAERAKLESARAQQIEVEPGAPEGVRDLEGLREESLRANTAVDDAKLELETMQDRAGAGKESPEMKVQQEKIKGLEAKAERANRAVEDAAARAEPRPSDPVGEPGGRAGPSEEIVEKPVLEEGPARSGRNGVSEEAAPKGGKKGAAQVGEAEPQVLEVEPPAKSVATEAETKLPEPVEPAKGGGKARPKNIPKAAEVAKGSLSKSLTRVWRGIKSLGKAYFRGLSPTNISLKAEAGMAVMAVAGGVLMRYDEGEIHSKEDLGNATVEASADVPIQGMNGIVGVNDGIAAPMCSGDVGTALKNTTDVAVGFVTGLASLGKAAIRALCSGFTAAAESGSKHNNTGFDQRKADIACHVVDKVFSAVFNSAASVVVVAGAIIKGVITNVEDIIACGKGDCSAWGETWKGYGKGLANAIPQGAESAIKYTEIPGTEDLDFPDWW